MGELQKNLTENGAQQLSVQEQRMDLLYNSLEEQKKFVSDSARLLKDLLIGIENLGDNMKTPRKRWTTGEIYKS